MNLTTYKITYNNGASYFTNMASGVTLEDAKNYFLGKSFEQPDGSLLKVANVETAHWLDKYIAEQFNQKAILDSVAGGNAAVLCEEISEAME